VRLSLEQGRVIGCLIEKQLTTPQQYPLTLNALLLACNQTSNREPVVSYEEGTVQRALASLKELGLVRFIYPSSGRSATRFRQALGESLGLELGALALLAVLLLRGAQTAGELRTRTERMATFDGLGELTAELEQMAKGDEPLVEQLSRRPGQKEERWVQLLTPGAPTSQAFSVGATPGTEQLATRIDIDEQVAYAHAGVEARSLAEQVASLRAEVAELRAVVAQLQADLTG